MQSGNEVCNVLRDDVPRNLLVHVTEDHALRRATALLSFPNVLHAPGYQKSTEENAAGIMQRVPPISGILEPTSQIQGEEPL